MREKGGVREKAKRGIGGRDDLCCRTTFVVAGAEKASRWRKAREKGAEDSLEVGGRRRRISRTKDDGGGALGGGLAPVGGGRRTGVAERRRLSVARGERASENEDFAPHLRTRGLGSRGKAAEGADFPPPVGNQTALCATRGQFGPRFLRPGKRPGSLCFPCLPNEPL